MAILRQYLKNPKLLLTNSQIDEKRKSSNNAMAKKIILLNTNEVFDTIKLAEEKYGVSNSSICNCCRKKYKYAGKHPETWECISMDVL